MDENFYDSYRPNASSRPQRQAATRNNGVRPRVQADRVAKPSIPSSGGIPPRRTSRGSVGGGRNTRSGQTPKRIPDPLIFVDEERSQFDPYQLSYNDYQEPARDFVRDMGTCPDIHHQYHEETHAKRLNYLSQLPPDDRIIRAQNIFLRDRTARPILSLGLPTWSSQNLRELLYTGPLKSQTSKIHSPRTRSRFLDWQSKIDDQTHHCWHGVDTYDLDPLVRHARQELSSGLPARVMPHRDNGLRLLQRRPTLDILTPGEREELIEWWEDHNGRKVLTPTQRKFPWARFGERHYLQRKARQAEKDKNQKLYDIGLLSPGTAATLREHGKLHSDYRERRRTNSLSLRREPTQESKMTTRTW